ncbi:MAG TPA: tryptophan synthase subunit alpha [Bacteroidales bacterium]|nr:tryptophan synthase subunit alpha [Bacteroidales bacterium]
MNRINKLFQTRKGKILSIYFTAGYPSIDSTVEILKALEAAGADMVEIGMPFSDPVADGPVIQNSSQQALNNGMSVKLLFRQLENIREQVNIPLLLMGYLNPVVHFGINEFCMKCEEVGIDGVILPDLPADVFVEEYSYDFKRHNLHNIFLITPRTTESRIHEIDKLSDGFIYMVSSASTTGARDSFSAKDVEYFSRISKMRLNNNCLVGFGVSNKKTFSQVCDYTSGAIIGSAFVKMLNEKGTGSKGIKNFIDAIRQ